MLRAQPREGRHAGGAAQGGQACGGVQPREGRHGGASQSVVTCPAFTKPGVPVLKQHQSHLQSQHSEGEGRRVTVPGHPSLVT